MSQTTTKRALRNCGPTTFCPKCRTTVYVHTMEHGLCVLCNLPAKREPTMEDLIAAVTAKMERVK